jgi:hypothetical protein
LTAWHRCCSDICRSTKEGDVKKTNITASHQADKEGQKTVPELITQNGSHREEITLEEAFRMLMLYPHEYFRNYQSLTQWCSCPPSALICLSSKDAEKSCCSAGYYRLNCLSPKKAIAMLDEIRELPS